MFEGPRPGQQLLHSIWSRAKGSFTLGWHWIASIYKRNTSLHIEYVEECIDGLVQERRNSSALTMEFPVFFAPTHQSSLLYLMILLPVIVSINPGFLWKKYKIKINKMRRLVFSFPKLAQNSVFLTRQPACQIFFTDYLVWPWVLIGQCICCTLSCVLVTCFHWTWGETEV